MTSRESYLQQIISKISIWQSEIQLKGEINLYDGHIIAQYHAKKLLNFAYGYELQDLNNETKNQVGIDLGDRKLKFEFPSSIPESQDSFSQLCAKFQEDWIKINWLSKEVS